MVYDFFSKISLKFDTPFIVNEQEAFYTFHKGKYTETRVPDFIKDAVKSGKTLGMFLEKGDKIYIVSVPVLLENVRFNILFKDSVDFNNFSFFFRVLFEFSYSVDFDLFHVSREMEMLKDEFFECERELLDYQKRASLAEEQLSKKNLELEGYIESVNILRKSRAKMLKLIDGIQIPLFSVDTNFELVNVNKAVGVFAGEEKLPHFIGCKCFKLIFDREETCPWCRFEEVVASKNSLSQNINILKNGKERIYEHTFFPIFDNTGEVTEVGESLNDITEHYELIENLKKTKDEMLKVSKDKINGINEINLLRNEFEKLNEAYELSRQKVNKLSVALQKIMEQSNVRELLSLKNENIEIKKELKRCNDVVSNYRFEWQKKQSEMLEISRKSAYSIERLINIIEKRKTISDEDLARVFGVLKTQVEEIKSRLNKEDTDDNKSSN